jgi:ATP-dependent RNA helicase DeaD
MEFEKLLGTDNPLLKAIKDRGFEIPTEIQKKAIPIVLEGNDVIAGASTGSGKTLAFAAGLINNIQKDFGIQGLVLTPTRELAEQVAEELLDFSKFKDLDVIPVYGGVPINNQIKRLANADIVVGTPGRVLDHIEKNSIDLSRINTLVLDEADRMLDMGFIEDVEKIIANCPNKRQTMLFSATISQDVVRIAQRHMKNPKEVSAEQYVDPSKLEQLYYDISDNLKYSLLKHLLENEKTKLIMVFCNTRRNVDFISNNLKFMGIETLPIHGGFSQEKRNRMLEQFHARKVNILVATDVAARGLDIKGVSHVFNYDIPPSKDEYVHRIGRTARAGKEGKVINILASRDYDNFSNLTNGEFNIIRVEAPFVQRARIRWMPERKEERFQRRRNNFGRMESNGNNNHNRNNGNRFWNDNSNNGKRFGNNNRFGKNRFNKFKKKWQVS